MVNGREKTSFTAIDNFMVLAICVHLFNSIVNAGL